MAQFYEEIDDKNVMTLAPTKRVPMSRFDDVAIVLLKRIEGCQKEMSNSEGFLILNLRNTLKRNMLSG